MYSSSLSAFFLSYESVLDFDVRLCPSPARILRLVFYRKLRINYKIQNLLVVLRSTWLQFSLFVFVLKHGRFFCPLPQENTFFSHNFVKFFFDELYIAFSIVLWLTTSSAFRIWSVFWIVWKSTTLSHQRLRLVLLELINCFDLHLLHINFREGSVLVSFTFPNDIA